MGMDAPAAPSPSDSEDPILRLLGFEVLLADLSAAFVAVPPFDVEKLIETWLARVVEFLDLDRSSVFRFRADGSAELVDFSVRPGIEPTTEVPFERFAWYGEELRRGRTIVMAHLPDDLPPEATAERDYVMSSGIRANLSIPLTVGGERVGAIGFAGFHYPRPWPPEIVQRLRVVGDVIGNALARKKADESLRRSEARLRRVLEAVPDALLLVRADGTIFFANEAASRTFGYRRAEVLDMPVERLVPALDPDTRAAALSAPDAVWELPNIAGRERGGRDLRVDVRMIRGAAGDSELVCLFRPSG
jgi:PAS domain S-box-containing protein